MNYYKIIHPESRMIAEDRLIQWACDAIDDGEADIIGAKSKNDAKRQIREDVRLAIEILDDLGIVTVSSEAYH